MAYVLSRYGLQYFDMEIFYEHSLDQTCFVSMACLMFLWVLSVAMSNLFMTNVFMAYVSKS